MSPQRRRPGEGSVFKYKTADDVTRFGIKFDAPSADGQRRQVMRRRDSNGKPWLDRDAANAALREAMRGISPTRSWACLVPECRRRSVTEAPVLLCADHRDLLVNQVTGKRRGVHAPVVYFARNGSRVKIGWTANLQARMERLSLRMSAAVLTLPGGPELERDLHGQFAASHIEGEWFELTPDLESFINAQLASGDGQEAA
jgi:hypothetical protein